MTETEIMDVLTRRPGERYFTYIKRVKQNENARISKLAELDMDIRFFAENPADNWSEICRLSKAYGILIDGWRESEELENCPFCGCCPKVEIIKPGSQIYEPIVYLSCACGVGSMPPQKWNTRPEEDRLKAENERLLHVIVSFGAENNRLKAENEWLKEALRQILEIANLRFNATVDTLKKNAWYEVAKIANNALANDHDMDDGRITETNGTQRAIVEVAVENSDGEKVVFTVPYSEKQCSMDYETNMPGWERK